VLTHASDVEFILLKKLRPLEWFDNQHKPNSNFRKLLQERIEKANPRRNLTAKEVKRREKLEAIAKKLQRGENVQNRQLQTWLNDDEYTQLEYEWQEQLELRSEQIYFLPLNI